MIQVGKYAQEGVVRMAHTKLRKETEAIVKYVLYDYPKLDGYIKKELEKVKEPYPNYRGQPIVLVKSMTLIERSREQKEIIESLLERSPEWVQELIELMYFNNKRYTVTLASELVGYDRRTGQKYHKEFLHQLATELGIWTG